MNASTSPSLAKVAAVVLTRDRPAWLATCLTALAGQLRQPDLVIVVDNAGNIPAAQIVAQHLPCAQTLRLPTNAGAARGFNAGILAARANGATHLWLMDDDGRPAGPDTLARLLATSSREGADLACPLVCDCAHPDRLAFPIRRRGRTRFATAELGEEKLIRGFAHLFNGALITASTFDRIGLPLEQLFIRGDEMEFLLRARRAGLRIITDTDTGFLHPASASEIHPILAGTFYAVVPLTALKRHYQFRNRGWIFARYNKWGWLAADHIRYALHFLVDCRDPPAFAFWLRATWSGVLGRLEPFQSPAPSARSATCAVSLELAK